MADLQRLMVPANEVRMGDVLVVDGKPAAVPVDHIDDRGPALVIGYGNHAIIRGAQVRVGVLRAAAPPAVDGRRAVISALNAAVLEHEHAWAAALRPETDWSAAARRLAEAQLALADRYSDAASYIRAAALGSPALVDARGGA